VASIVILYNPVAEYGVTLAEIYMIL